MFSFVIESVVLYILAVLIITARYTSRWLQLGSIREFQIEDYVMLVVMAFYTSLIITTTLVHNLDTNLMLPEEIPELTSTSIKQRIRGSKLVLGVEQSMIMTQWGSKISLLLLYNKLTMGLSQNFVVKMVGFYVGITWIVMEILYLVVWCRPFNQYWAVPSDNAQCTTAINHLVINAIFNMTSDVMMLCIPIPILLAAKLPLSKKLTLCFLFSLGIFVILCACLNKYYSFHNPFSPRWEGWYIREASMTVYIANIPLCWTLLRHVFHLRAFGVDTSGSRSPNPPRRSPPNFRYSQRVPMNSKLGTNGRRQTWGDGDGAGNELPRQAESQVVMLSTSDSDPTTSESLEFLDNRHIDMMNARHGPGSLRLMEDGVVSLGAIYDGSTRILPTGRVVTIVTSPGGTENVAR